MNDDEVEQLRAEVQRLKGRRGDPPASMIALLEVVGFDVDGGAPAGA